MFYGRPTDNFHLWADRFDRYADAMNWTPATRKVVLPTMLRGTAEIVFNGINRTELADFSYDDLLAVLKTRFSPALSQEIKSTELHARRQLPLEPVIQYAASIQQLTHESYPDIDADTRNQLMKRFFLAGLYPEIWKLVIPQNPNTFTDAELTARKAEAQLHIFAQHSCYSTAFDPIPRPIPLLATQTPASSGHSRPTFNRSQGKPVCFYCKKLGHVAAVCRKRARDRSFNNNNRRNSFVPRVDRPSRPARLADRWNRPPVHTIDPPEDRVGVDREYIKFLEHENRLLSSKFSADSSRQEENPSDNRHVICAVQSADCPTELHEQEPALTRTGHNFRFRSAFISFLTASFLAFLIPSVGCMQFQLCSSSGGVPYSVPREVLCQPPKLFPVVVERARVFVPNNQPALVDAWKCVMKRRTVCTHMSVIGSKGIVLDQEKFIRMTVGECRRLHNTGLFQRRPLVRKSSEMAFSNNSIETKFEYCCRDYCQTSDNVVIQKGQVGTLDGDLILSNLAETPNCRVGSYSCETPDAVIIWHEPIQRPCRYIEPYKDQNFDIEMSGRYFIIQALQGAFTIFNRTPQQNTTDPCLPPFHFVTDQGVVLAFADNETYTRVLQLESSQVRVKRVAKHVDLNGSDPVNFKLQYLEAMLQNIETSKFRELWLTLCNFGQIHLRTVWQFLRFDPTMGARILLGRDDIHAQFFGETILVSQCRSINVSIIHYDHKIDDICYDLLPITDSDNVTYFKMSGSNDLVRKSSTIPCDSVEPGIFFDDNNRSWKTSSDPYMFNKFLLRFSGSIKQHRYC